MTRNPLTDAEVDSAVDRYTRGQSLSFICLAMSRDRRSVKAALEARGVKVRKGGKCASRNWGYTGSAA